MNTPRLLVVTSGIEYLKLGGLNLARGSARRYAAAISKLKRTASVNKYQRERQKVTPGETVVSSVGKGLRWDVKRGRIAKVMVSACLARTGERS